MEARMVAGRDGDLLRAAPKMGRTRMKKTVARKSPSKRPKSTGVMVEAKNGGMIWQGPSPNHVAGTGRPASAIRAAMRDTLSLDVLPRLHADWQAGEIKSSEYAEFLAKHGLAVKEEGAITPQQALAFVRIYESWLDRNLSPDLAQRARSEIRAELKAEGL